MKFSKKSQAVISVFLIITMLPLLGLAVVLVDGSRVQSAKMMVQEASDLAAMSTLAGYNKDLKNDYGLFALKDQNKAEAVFEAYLKSSLKAATGGNKEYSDQMYDAVKTAIFGEGSKISGFSDLFRYEIGSSKVEPLFPLSEKEVLQTQMIEYTKYRGVYLLADRLSILANLSDIKDQYEDTKKSTELMDKKLEIDEESEEVIEKRIRALNDKITNLYNAVNDFVNESNGNIVSTIRQILDAADHKYDENLEQEDQELSVALNLISVSLVKETLHSQVVSLNEKGTALKTSFEKVDPNEVTSLITAVSNQIEKLESFKKDQVETSNASVKEEMIEDINQTIKRYNAYKSELTELQKYFLGDKGRYENDKKNVSIATDSWGSTESAIKHSLADEMNSPAVIKEEGRSGLKWDRLDEVKESTGYHFRSNGYYNDSTNAAMGNYAGTSDSYNSSPVTHANKCKNIISNIAPIMGNTKKDEKQNDRRDIAENAAKEANSKKDDYGKKTIPSGEIASLPSKGKSTDTKDKSTFSTKAEDLTKDTDNILKGGNNFFASLGTATRDEALTFAYMFGMFKTRMSDSEKFNKSKKPGTMEKYHVPWRYEHDDGEHDLRERPKKDLDTVLDAEIEYIFGGHKSDQANCAAIYATIFGIRSANNIVAVYSNKDARSQCYELAVATAAAVAAATLGAVTLSPTIYQWIYITAWAIAETCAEMDFLINKGYKVPLVKTSKNLLMDSITDLATPSESRLGESVKNSFVSVCYEDYLLLLMLVLTNSETRVQRSSDLIQLNIRKRHDSGFLMKEAPTYIKAETGVSIDYLFHQISQFSEFYPGKGISFKNTIYQGY